MLKSHEEDVGRPGKSEKFIQGVPLNPAAGILVEPVTNCRISLGDTSIV